MFEQVLQAIIDHQVIIIHRHNNPDGDALGSQIYPCRLYDTLIPALYRNMPPLLSLSILLCHVIVSHASLGFGVEVDFIHPHFLRNLRSSPLIHQKLRPFSLLELCAFLASRAASGVTNDEQIIAPVRRVL